MKFIKGSCEKEKMLNEYQEVIIDLLGIKLRITPSGELILPKKIVLEGYA